MLQKPDTSINVAPKKILVLMGGWSGERHFSLLNGKDVAKALASLGHKVVTLDPPRNDLESLVRKIQRAFDGEPPEVIFNALLGRWGEDGIFQGFLELLGIPYTASNVLSSALSNNKRFTRQIVQLCGVNCPDEELVTREELLMSSKGLLKFPYILKPISEGASMGLMKISSLTDEERAVEMWPSCCAGKSMLAQTYIPGREITVLVLDGEAMGALEIRFEGELFDFSQRKEKNTYLMPAPIPAEDYELALRAAEVAHKALGCSGMTRSDFRYDDTAASGPTRLFYLETNAQPGIYRDSYAPAIAAHSGWTYEDLVEWIVQDALKKNKPNKMMTAWHDDPFEVENKGL